MATLVNGETGPSVEVTVAGEALVTAADAPAQRTALGLGTAATASSGDFDAAGAAAAVTASSLGALTQAQVLARGTGS